MIIVLLHVVVGEKWKVLLAASISLSALALVKLTHLQ